MGELILCNRKETDVPYYLEQNMINIYSLEELNWYISVSYTHLTLPTT